MIIVMELVIIAKFVIVLSKILWIFWIILTVSIAFDIVVSLWLLEIGKKHIQNLGMSMKLKKSTVEDVKARFELLKKKKQEEKKEYSLAERLKDAKEEQERMQSYTKDVSFIISIRNFKGSCWESKLFQVKKDKRNRKRRKEEEDRQKQLELKRAKVHTAFLYKYYNFVL